MSVIADWRWWTYFLVDGEIVTLGRIVSYDIDGRMIRYLRPTGRGHDDNPHPMGTPEYEAGLYDTIESHYQHLWVDPEKGIVMLRKNAALMEQGIKPPDFVELVDSDQETYFASSRQVISTYLPTV